MTIENRWKDKYLSILEASEATEGRLRQAEDTLRLAVNRLSLVASNSDETLDQQLNKLRTLVKKSSDNTSIRALLEEISITIKRLDLELNAGVPQRLPPHLLLAHILDDIQLPRDAQKKARDLKKNLKKKQAHLKLAQHIDEFVSIIHEAVESSKTGPNDDIPGRNTVSTESSEISTELKVEELFSQLRERLSNQTNLKQACTDLEMASTKHELEEAATKLVQLLLLDSNQKKTVTQNNHQEKNDTPPEKMFGELLDMLSLPKDLIQHAANIRKQLDKKLTTNEWPSVLSSIADMIALMRSEVEREKTELQAFLFQVTDELQNIDSSLVNTEERNIASLKSGEHLDNAMRSNFSELQTSVENESNLSNLRQIISQKMEKISTHLQEYRDTEIQRQEEVSAEIRALRSRVQNMESETTELNEKLTAEREQARTDPLTGINNRVAYEQRLLNEFERWNKGESGLSTIVCDIDHFKKINDTLGHQAGDKALQSIASVLKQNIRKSDFLARYGGEEFVVLVSHEINAEENIAAKIAEKIRTEVGLAEFKSKGDRVPITISCGYSSFRDGDEIDSAFGRADKALYRAKEQGRNRVEGDTAPS